VTLAAEVTLRPLMRVETAINEEGDMMAVPDLQVQLQPQPSAKVAPA